MKFNTHIALSFVLFWINIESAIFAQDGESALNSLSKPKYEWSDFWNELSPMVSYRFGGNIVHHGDPVRLRSLEFGLSLTDGHWEASDWSPGPVPFLAFWHSLVRPAITLEHRWFDRNYTYFGTEPETRKLNPWMLHVSSGFGGGFYFLPFIVPLSFDISGGIGTDFQDLYLRGRFAYSVLWLSFGVSGNLNVTKRNSDLYKSNFWTLDLSLNLWRDSW